MALGAGGASAADVPATSGLLGSVSDVVNSATAPLQTQTLLPPAATPATPGISALVPQVEHLVTEPLGTVLPQVDSSVGAIISQVPVVEAIAPPVAIAPVTAPVTAPVDAVVGGVTAPVLGVVKPIVLEPVIDVVEPIVDGVPAPVLPAPVDPTAPTVPVAPPAPVEEVAPALPGAAPAPALPAVPSVADAVGTPASSPSDGTVGAASPTVADSLSIVGRAFSAAAGGAAALLPTAAEAALNRTVEVAVLPVLVASTGATGGAGDVPLTSLVGSGAASSISGAGSAAPYAALGAASLVFVLLLSGRARRDAAAGLPSAPCFDPGSSPD